MLRRLKGISVPPGNVRDPHHRSLDYLSFFPLDGGVDLVVLNQPEMHDRLAQGNYWLEKVWVERLST
jgi:hypothetical protein